MTLALVLEAPLQRPEYVAMFDSMRWSTSLPADAPTLFVLPNHMSDGQRVEVRDVEEGSKRIHAELVTLGASVVVAFGVTATWALCGTGSHVERLGKWQETSGVHVMPTHHPALLCRRAELREEAWEHMVTVMKKLGKRCDKCGIIAFAAQKVCRVCKS